MNGWLVELLRSYASLIPLLSCQIRPSSCVVYLKPTTTNKMSPQFSIIFTPFQAIAEN